jgi:hypothetical protein
MFVNRSVAPSQFSHAAIGESSANIHGLNAGAVGKIPNLSVRRAQDQASLGVPSAGRAPHNIMAGAPFFHMIPIPLEGKVSNSHG